MNDPLETMIHHEEVRQLVEDAHKRIELLIQITFHRPELFDAWYARNIQSATITAIAEAQGIGWKVAKHRVDTAQEIVISLRKQLHKLDDVRL